MAPPELTDDVVEEILLRLPPDDPSCSARASAVCKPWRRLLSDPVFLRRHRAFHRRRAPPLLGFIHHFTDEPVRRIPCFARFGPTTAFRPAEQERKGWWALDCRHGRVLFQCSYVELAVWDPMTGDVRRQREPDDIVCAFSTAAVLCAVPGCDHHDCHGGPFVLVFVGNDGVYEGNFLMASASSYSSETGTWTAPSTVEHDESLELESKPSVLAGDAVHFLTYFGKAILRYDLTNLELSVILPPVAYGDGDALLMTAEDGELGLALFDGEASIHLWARVAGAAGGDPGWVRRNMINLYAVLPFFDPAHSLSLVGFAEGTDIIFLHTTHGDYRMELSHCRSASCGRRADASVG
uniref:F-box domain-containing protein n=1 Tax=Oryza meridionalis TaxID=40149 RepID=A0A0E0E734_9ORYZ